MKKIITILIIMLIVLSVMIAPAYAVNFSDVPQAHWAYTYINELSDKGIINGYQDGTYKPEKNVTRGEFFKLIMTSAYGEEACSAFSTVIKDSHWATKYAKKAEFEGLLMNGTDTDNLNADITRLEMVHILAKVCLSNLNVEDLVEIFLSDDVIGASGEVLETPKEIEFTDIQELDESSKVYIRYVTMLKIINGYTDGSFKPDKTMTRAEVATVMSRFEKLKSMKKDVSGDKTLEKVEGKK